MTAPALAPLLRSGAPRPREAISFGHGPLWLSALVAYRLGKAPRCHDLRETPPAIVAALCAPRAPICGLVWDRPRIMGILNITPDSFSDGGRFAARDAALAQARALIDAGADILDIGGESTRPGADPVPVDAEIARVVPVIAELRACGITTPISIDTRKAAVAQAALDAGADLINDVSALSHDPASLSLAARRGVPVCLMHARCDPQTMQAAPAYDDVLLDVFAYLRGRIAAAEAAGIPRARILVDPGIGFGKTLAHNLALIRGLALLHATGCAVLLGASRKRFIGTIGGAEEASERMPGSIAVALEGLRQGAHVVRVHDVAETRQAIRLWRALIGADDGED